MDKKFLNALDDWGSILTGTYEKNATTVVPTRMRADGVLKIDVEKCKDVGLLKGAIEIPEGVASVPSSAFTKCHDITNVIFPESMRTVSVFAFSECNNLKSIHFNWGVETIKSFAFAFNPSLKTINLPNSLKRIEPNAFEGCGLEGDLVIPGYIEYLGDSIFLGNKNLNGTLTIEEGIKEIPMLCFTRCNFSGHLEIPKSVVKIGLNAFRGNENLTSLKLNEGLKFIDDYAFEECSSLTGELTIPRTVNVVGESIFNLTNFSKIYVPKVKVNKWNNNWDMGCTAEIIYY